MTENGQNASSDSPWAEGDIQNVYRQALKYYKVNEGKTISLAYAKKLRLVALTQQVLHGQFSPDKVPPLGALDMIGQERRNVWKGLGDLSKEDAMRQFVEAVLESMPNFASFMKEQEKAEESRQEEAEAEDKARLALDEEQKANLESERLAQLERQRQEDQRRLIQDALNKQTFGQFRAYAEQQYPSNPDQQAVLIRQLQEQHYYQYMQQIYQQQMETHASDALNVSPNNAKTNENGKDKDPSLPASSSMRNDPLNYEAAEAGNGDELTSVVTNGMANLEVGDDDLPETEDDLDDGHEHSEGEDGEEYGYGAEEEVSDVPAASMWTKTEMEEFKTSIREAGPDGVIKVAHGETVTIRVPTAEDGAALFWEFATDGYDIAFGVFFEWNKTDETEISVHVSDSEDEDLDDEYLDENGDPENGSTTAALMDKGPPTSVVVPIYRRDCHKEVYVGTHPYPDHGVYLLKFDNTYSLWRSKTLYYRVFYTK